VAEEAVFVIGSGLREDNAPEGKRKIETREKRPRNLVKKRFSLTSPPEVGEDSGHTGFGQIYTRRRLGA